MPGPMAQARRALPPLIVNINFNSTFSMPIHLGKFKFQFNFLILLEINLSEFIGDSIFPDPSCL